MNWLERHIERLRSINTLTFDAVIAAVFVAVGLATVFGQDVRDASGALTDGFREPSAAVVLTVLATCIPVALRRRAPLPALTASVAGIAVHILIGWPEGSLPLATLLITYTVGAWCPVRQAVAGLLMVSATIIVLAVSGAPGLDAVGVFGVLAQFGAAWAIGVALRNRRGATEARVREAEERAEAERQSAARALAEERLRIAQELHDVVAHSMSVIAVQAGVGVHVLGDRPEQARTALEAISATSRGTLAELRRLLGVLRDDDGSRRHVPAPSLADVPSLVEDVRAAGVPVTLHVEGDAEHVHPGIELSAYRVVQEALTNVIKHAGKTTRVTVSVCRGPGSLTVEVVDDGRGLAARGADDGAARAVLDGGHGLIGMRERVELWGGELSVGPAHGGGYRVTARLPYEERA